MTKFAFISYSHQDKKGLERLLVHLKPLADQGLINVWHDRENLAGDSLKKEISEKLESCDLFLALISPDYLASDECKFEMDRALERHKSGTVRIVSLIMNYCQWRYMPFSELLVLPEDGIPICSWDNEDKAFHDVVTELRRILTRDREVAHKPASKQTLATHPVSHGYSVKGKRARDKLREQYRSTKLNIIDLLLTLGNSQSYQDRENLLDQQEFKRFFKCAVSPDMSRWDAVASGLEENDYHFRDVLNHLHMLNDEIRRAITAIDIDNVKVTEYLSHYSQVLSRMDMIENDYDDIKLLCRHLWSFYTGYSFVDGYPDTDVMQDMIDRIK